MPPVTIPPSSSAAAFAHTHKPPPPVLPNQSVTVPSVSNAPANPTIIPPSQMPARSDAVDLAIPSSSHQNMSGSFASTNNFSFSSEEEEPAGRGRKRRWKDFFERLMKDVIERQEEMQARFLEAMERRERERTSREEAWRVQETARMNREHELLAQERSMAAAKDAALISFLQKMTTTELQPDSNTNADSAAAPHPPKTTSQQQEQPPLPPPPPQAAAEPPPPHPPPPETNKGVHGGTKADNGGENFAVGAAGSSRWPKPEVEALIMLRTNMDIKYQENGPKGPLWEEISAGMRKMGYNRSSKRCKEKWENINKYFKKVKESNKKRPEDSKTCPYFHRLDALYREKAKSDGSFSIKPDNPNVVVPIMARPEQQWPLPQNHHRQQQQQEATQPADHAVGKNHDQEEEDADEEEDEDEYEEEDEDDDEGNGFEIVTNKQSTVATTIE